MNQAATRLLLISNSTQFGKGYLDHAEDEIRDFIGDVRRICFVPFALYDRQAYTAKVRERLRKLNCEVVSVHEVSNATRALEAADAVFVGGGNTFRLLKALYDWNLLEVIRRAVGSGKPYIGSSAGSIVAGPTIKTTKDMPIVQPPSFDALGLVEFQISPHYLDPDPDSTHMGETQEERILQFLEENDSTVVGLREGGMVRVEKDSVALKGLAGARIFTRDQAPREAAPGEMLSRIILSRAGVAA